MQVLFKYFVKMRLTKSIAFYNTILYNYSAVYVGHLAQLVEHSLDVRRVSGSSPLMSTTSAIRIVIADFFKRKDLRKMNKNIQNYPAVPLITCDPYFNVWSMTEKLNDDFPRHWTGMQNPLTGILKIDGKEKIFMGKKKHNPFYNKFFGTPDKIEQVNLEITPLKTIYKFKDDVAELEICFTTPLLPDDLKLLSRPVSYMSYNVKTTDGKKHDIGVYVDVSGMLCTDTPDEKVFFGKSDNYVFLSSGTEKMLKKSGDDTRINWGKVCLSTPNGKMGFTNDNRKGRDVEEYKEMRVMDSFPAIYALDEYKESDSARGFFCFGYDDILSLEYFGQRVKGYWTKDREDFDDVLTLAINDYNEIMSKVDEFDNKMIADAEKISPEYVKVISIAYRQAVAAHKLAWDGETGLFVSKECFSNGCAATVDVTYPSIPLFLIYNPDLVEYMLNPIFKFAYSDKWQYEFAPHDAGQYPIVNGQVYGDQGIYGGHLRLQSQMPVEECGNMLLCVAALCKKKGNTKYAEKHFDILTKWAEYLVKYGYNPGNQLCTDDFAGHLAHNCNLSVKAIMGMAAWGMLLRMMGKEDKYTAIAKQYAEQWKKDAFDKDHYKLAFDKEDTWSIKYNLVWDKLFNLEIFDDDIFETEVKYYKSKVNKYGLPLDCRSLYTKSDWQMWSTILTDDKEYTDMIVTAMLKMLNDTVDKAPFTDWYYTHDAHQVGFQNRTVQGGLFINMLTF